MYCSVIWGENLLTVLNTSIVCSYIIPRNQRNVVIPDIVGEAKNRSLRWAGNIFRREDERLTKEV